MLGRGIDQIQLQSCSPQLFEGYVTSANDYVTLAERASGAIPRPVGPRYVWGDLLDDLDARDVDLRLVNLETAITLGGTYDPGKGIHYRMHPANVALLKAARIDAVMLANNHVLDWGSYGLAHTLAALEDAGITRAGAGLDGPDAFAPRVLPCNQGGRLVMFAFALGDAGVPQSWQAGPGKPGVSRAEPAMIAAVVKAQLAQIRQPGDIVFLSIHWGGNWGYPVSATHRALAERLVAEGVDLVFGHSSHHPRAAMVRDGRLVLYGAGDLINDYEGIGGNRAFRPELVLGYVADIARKTGELMRLEMLPYQLHRFRLSRADSEARHWLAWRLNSEAHKFGGKVEETPQATLRLQWAS